jgi:hypothetical protein
MGKLSASSQARIQRFVDWFIRTEYAANWAAEKDSDFINERARAERCYAAAEHGGCGRTHAEVIEDWREAFHAWMSDRGCFVWPERFEAAVCAHFDGVEAWHARHGSLDCELG